MSRRFTLGARAAAAVAAAAVAVPLVAGSATAKNAHDAAAATRGAVSHVLLISVDGLHQSDLRWYVRTHPDSELAWLVNRSAEYSRAQTVVPSDSDPGMTGQMTGGDPRATGVYYDVEYNHNLLPAGTTSCHGQPTGADVIYDSPDDIDATKLDAGQGLPGLPGSILSMTSTPQDLLNPATFPVDPKTCKPIAPDQYLKVNTIFNVVHNAGLRTAWSDKHPVYTSFNGPVGNGIDDSFDPEIDSKALFPDGTLYPGAISWTGDNAATMQYDAYKVQAILNEIDGYDHSRTQLVGTPALFGMNFQTVSTAEKLPSSDGLPGGYQPGTTIPGPLLTRAITYVSNQLAAMADELRIQGLLNQTAIIVSAKHGQSPQDPYDLTRIDDRPIIAGVNAAWATLHPSNPTLLVSGTDDDAIMWWLSDRSPAAARFVTQYLMSHTATGNTFDGNTRTLAASGLTKVFAGAAAARYFGVPVGEPRHPDVWGIVQPGVVYTGGKGKIAEHGGANAADRDVPIVVYAPRAVAPGGNATHLETTSIAPTILRLLGLDPTDLGAVRIEGTPVLPGVR